jgi:GNAT superfamily N-acetyltransferase
MTGRLLVREAVTGDAPAIARLHVDAWRATYRDLMPPAAVEAHSYADREAGWSEALGTGGATSLFIAECDGALAGFAACGPNRGEEPEFDGELYAIYLDAAYQRRGAGRALFETARQRLRERGFRTMLLWVLDGNEAADAFYRGLGGRRWGAGSFELGHETLREHGYAFDT